MSTYDNNVFQLASQVIDEVCHDEVWEHARHVMDAVDLAREVIHAARAPSPEYYTR